MDKIEYQMLKGAAKQQFGVCNREVLNKMVEQSSRPLALFKSSIVVGVIALPLCFIGVGYVVLFGAGMMYFFAYAKPKKNLEDLRQLIANDPELDLQVVPQA